MADLGTKGSKVPTVQQTGTAKKYQNTGDTAPTQPKDGLQPFKARTKSYAPDVSVKNR